MSAKYTLVLGLHLLSTALFLKLIDFVLPFLTTRICSCISFYVSWICLAAITFQYTKDKFLNEVVDTRQKAVLITGCDTGFGHELAKRLDSKGFHVFASCLFPDGNGASQLKASCSNRLHILPLDVTQNESVERAVKYVKDNLGSSELWAVVNNAGILKGFSVEMSTVNDFRDVFEVNFLGMVRVIKAFLPQLKKSKGRIVNVTSYGGEVSFPFFTPYIASKFAAVGFTDCLRHETHMEGISVVSVEPEIFKTQIICEDTIHKHLDSRSENLKTSIKEECDEYAKSVKDLADAFMSFACTDIRIVVDDLEAGVSLVHPDHTYKPRRHPLFRFLLFCLEIMPRSFQILFFRILLYISFSKFKMLKTFGMKIISTVL